MKDYLQEALSYLTESKEAVVIDGRIDLSSCKNIKSLGRLKKVGGDLDLTNSSIEDLGELKEVGILISGASEELKKKYKRRFNFE